MCLFLALNPALQHGNLYERAFLWNQPHLRNSNYFPVGSKFDNNRCEAYIDTQPQKTWLQICSVADW